MPYADLGAISVHYLDAGVPSGPYAGPPILLLPELGGSGDSWAAVIPVLARECRVIAPDYRCAGRSEKPPGEFPLEAVADDAARLLAVLGVERADVVGGALGSLVGALLAARHPETVRGLAMFAAAADMSGRTTAYLTERAARVRKEGMRPVMRASLANAFTERFAAEMTAYEPIYLANDPNGYAALSLALAQTRFGPAVWDAIKAPALVVSGAHDFIWPPELGRQVAGLIAGARFEVLAEAAHFPHLQTPTVVARMVASFRAML